MDSNKKRIYEIQIRKTMENLEKNNMQAVFVENAAQVVPTVQVLLHEGDTVTVGGSATLAETGVIELLKSGKYRYLDRYAPGLSHEQTEEVFRGAFSADAYLCSANAVTQNGELYNVDGHSNRVAAMLFGPKSVIVVAGYNKIVPDLPSAEARVKYLAAPANAVRFSLPLPCAKTGHCMECASDSRICCNFVVFAHQREKHRIKVILVGEELGY